MIKLNEKGVGTVKIVVFFSAEILIFQILWKSPKFEV